MEGMDLNWCLSCNTHIDGPALYCSRECYNAIKEAELFSSIPGYPSVHQQPSAGSRSYPSSRALSVHQRSQPSTSSLSSYASSLQAPTPPPPPPQPSQASWIGKGPVGIQQWASAVPAGAPSPVLSAEVPYTEAMRPAALSQPTLKSSRKPAPPKLFVTISTGNAAPSRPVTTPYLAHSNTSTPAASLTSLTTGLSSLSIMTPADDIDSTLDSVAVLDEEDMEDPPSAETQRPSIFSSLATHIKNWAASNAFSEATLPTSHAQRERELKRSLARSQITTQRPHSNQQLARQTRTSSPPSVWAVPENLLLTKEKLSGKPRTEAEVVQAFRSRGRRTQRVAP